METIMQNNYEGYYNETGGYVDDFSENFLPEPLWAQVQKCYQNSDLSIDQCLSIVAPTVMWGGIVLLATITVSLAYVCVHAINFARDVYRDKANIVPQNQQ